MKCLCPQCTPNPAPTYTEEFRHSCEVRHVVDVLQTDGERRAYLEEVGSARGEKAATALRMDAWNELKRRRASTNPTGTSSPR